MRRVCCLILFCSLIGSCSVDEAVELDHFIHAEEEGDLIQLNLTWKVNGQADDGVMADMLLYVTESKDMDDANLSESLGDVTVSSFDYSGVQRITPSTTDIFDAYRYYIGVACHGFLQTTAFPATIDYEINIVTRKSQKLVHKIEGSFQVSAAEAQASKVVYVYTMDFYENQPEMTHQNYSFRKIAEPLVVNTSAHLASTNTFNAAKPLHARLLWKVNGKYMGYKDIDLDLYIHNTNNSVYKFEEMDYYSLSSEYERISMHPEDSYFQPNIPEKIGFYYFEKISPETPLIVEYLFRIHQYDGSLKRFTYSNSFSSANLQPHKGTFYFVANIRKTADSYVVEPFSQPQAWTP